MLWFEYSDDGDTGAQPCYRKLCWDIYSYLSHQCPLHQVPKGTDKACNPAEPESPSFGLLSECMGGGCERVGGAPERSREAGGLEVGAGGPGSEATDGEEEGGEGSPPLLDRPLPPSRRGITACPAAPPVLHHSLLGRPPRCAMRSTAGGGRLISVRSDTR